MVRESRIGMMSGRHVHQRVIRIESSDDEHVGQDFRGLSEMDQGIGTSSRPASTARSLHQTSTRPRTSSTRRPRAETPLFYPRSSSSFSPDKAPTVSTDPLALSSERDEASDFEVIGGLDGRYGQASSDGESVMVVPRTDRKGKGKEKARQVPPTPSESTTSSPLRFPPIMRSAAPQDVVVEIPFMSLSTLRTYKHDNPSKRSTHKSRDKTLQESSARGDPSSSTSSFTPLTVMAKPKREPPSRRAVNVPSRWSAARKVKPSSDGEYGLEESEGDQEGDVESESEDELAMRRSKRTRVNSRGRGKAGQREAKPKPKEWALRERNRPRQSRGDSIASSYSHHRSIKPTRSPRRSMRKQAEDSDGSEPDGIQEQAGSSEPEGEDEIEEYRLGESEVDSEEDRLVVEPEVISKALQQHRPFCEKCSRERADVMLEKATKRKLKSGKRKKQDDDEISDGEQAHLLLGWLECEKCVISSHWNCLGAGQQKQVLSDLLVKEGPPDAGEKPRRSLGIDEQATFVCTRCTADPKCFECHEEKVVDAATAPAGVKDKDGDIKMQEENDPLDDQKPRAEVALLFRCHRCHSSCHYEHMKPVEGDGPESLAERAEHYQRAQKKVDAWHCHKCREWPWTVDIICAWRPLPPDAQSIPEELDHKPDYKEALQREYLVKWTLRGFRHATWVPHWWLKEIARQKLRSFLEKGPALNLITDQTLAAAGDDIAEPTIAKVMAEDDRVNGSRSKGHHNQPDQWQGHGPAPDVNAEASIPNAWRTVDRVLDVMLVPPKPKAKPKPKHQALKRGGRVLSVSASPSPSNDDEDVQVVAPHRPDGMEPPSTDRMDIDVWEESTGKTLTERDIDMVAPLVTWCLVKWDDLQYDQSCWDTPPPVDSPLYPAFKHALERYLKARQVVIPVLTPKQRQAREAEAARVREPPTEQPACLVGGTLMPFQMEGFQWLLYKYFRRESCILADDMGLGKTVQIASLLGYLGSDEFKIYPCLVVVPNSTITNWVREFEKWVPHLRVVPYYGEAASRKVISQYELYHKSQQGKAVGLKAHIVLTTYDMITGNEFRVFSDIPRWEMLCVDEGQRLKSDSNLIFNRLKTLNTVHRILLTGTPLNNNLRELFNLLNFLDKETFRDLADLEARFADLNEGLIQELHEMIKPYILRRIKADVLKLPLKIEIIVPISLTPLQKSVYKGILEKNAEILKAVTEARRKRAPKAIAPATEPQDTAKP